MVPVTGKLTWGEAVISRDELDPRHDRLGLYLWGTIVWHLLILLGTVLLVIGGDVLLAY